MIKALIIFIVYTFSILSASEIDEIELSFIQKGIDYTLSEEFDKAEAIYQRMIERNPDHPAGYFSLASLYNAKKLHYETDLYTKEIDDNYQKAICLAEKKLKLSGDDPWLYYYLGAAKCNISFQEKRAGKYFAAFRSAFGGISEIEKCLEVDSSFIDAKMLLGGYKYYKSSLIHWIYDDRVDGIKMIEEVILNSKFSKYFAISAISWILIDFEKYDEAIEFADIGLEQYPDSRYFLWSKAEALFLQEEYEKSNTLYLRIKDSLKNDALKTNINNVFCCLKLAGGYYFLGQKEKASYYINEGLSYNLTKFELERLENSLAELEKFKLLL